MDAAAFEHLFAFTGIDTYSNRPRLCSSSRLPLRMVGYFQNPAARHFMGRITVLQASWPLEFNGAVAQ